MKRLIVSADDVGLVPGITAGALRALRDGIVTSISVMTATSGWDATRAALVDAGVTHVGVHMTLCEGRPVLAAERIPTLVDPSGAFPIDFGAVVRRVATGRVDRGELTREWIAQVRRAQEAGFRVTHVDGHKHAHLLPGLPRVCRAVLEATGVQGLRRPHEPGPGPRRGVRAALSLASTAAGRCGRAPDRCVGIGVAGGLTEDRLLELLGRLPDGTSELVSHPGAGGAQLVTAMEADGLAWGRDYGFGDELAALTSPRVRAAVEAADIELISWATFLEGAPV